MPCASPIRAMLPVDGMDGDWGFYQDDVGYLAGGHTGISYLVVSVHFDTRTGVYLRSSMLLLLAVVKAALKF